MSSENKLEEIFENTLSRMQSGMSIQASLESDTNEAAEIFPLVELTQVARKLPYHNLSAEKKATLVMDIKNSLRSDEVLSLLPDETEKETTVKPVMLFISDHQKGNRASARSSTRWNTFIKIQEGLVAALLVMTVLIILAIASGSVANNTSSTPTTLITPPTSSVIITTPAPSTPEPTLTSEPTTALPTATNVPVTPEITKQVLLPTAPPEIPTIKVAPINTVTPQPAGVVKPTVSNSNTLAKGLPTNTPVQAKLPATVLTSTPIQAKPTPTPLPATNTPFATSTQLVIVPAPTPTQTKDDEPAATSTPKSTATHPKPTVPPVITSVAPSQTPQAPSATATEDDKNDKSNTPQPTRLPSPTPNFTTTEGKDGHGESHSVTPTVPSTTNSDVGGSKKTPTPTTSPN